MLRKRRNDYANLFTVSNGGELLAAWIQTTIYYHYLRNYHKGGVHNHQKEFERRRRKIGRKTCKCQA